MPSDIFECVRLSCICLRVSEWVSQFQFVCCVRMMPRVVCHVYKFGKIGKPSFQVMAKCSEKTSTRHTHKCWTVWVCCVCVWEKKRAFRYVIILILFSFSWDFVGFTISDGNMMNAKTIPNINSNSCVHLSHLSVCRCVYTLNSGNTSILCNKHRLFHPLHSQLNILRSFSHSAFFFSQKFEFSKQNVYEPKII